VVVAGFIVMMLFVAPVFHKYVLPPDALNCAVLPAQMVCEFASAITGSSVTLMWLVSLHPE